MQNKSTQNPILVSTQTRVIPLGDLRPEAALKHLSETYSTCVAIERKSNSTEAGALYIYVDPYDVITVQSGQTTSERNYGAESYRDRPLQNLQKIVNQYKYGTRSPGIEDQTTLPFVRAAIGYLGYDCVQYLEDIRLPVADRQTADACFAVFRTVFIFHELQGTVTIAINCFSDEEHANGESNLQTQIDRLHATPVLATASSSTPELRRAFNESVFTRQVTKIKEHIRRGDVFQCVLSQRAEFESLSSPIDAFETLRRQNPSPYHFYFKARGQTLVGASPEPLIKVKGPCIQTFPIAGTRPRGATKEADRKQRRNLRASRKENAEHLMLVDLSRNDLGKICTAGSVKVTEFMRIQTLSHVMHLVSLVEGQLPDQQSAFAALLACFPAGTLTGAPKVRAMQLIAELEQERRGLYGGALVMLDFNGDLDSCILIRSLVDNGERSYVQAGAGIVADSRADREFLEIKMKSAAVRRAIGGAV